MSGCYQCGDLQGTELKLCPTCSRANDAKREALRGNLRVNTDVNSDSFVHRFFSHSRFQANVLVIGWYLLTFVLVLLGTEVGIPIWVSLVASILLTSIALFVVTFILSWLSLMVFDLIQGLIVLILPFMLYRTFIRMWRLRFLGSDWKSHEGVILAHLMSIALFCAAFVGMGIVGDRALLRADRLFQKNYGFSPVRPLIAMGLVKKEFD